MDGRRPGRRARRTRIAGRFEALPPKLKFPMKFRPDDDPRNVAEGEPVDWADTSISNLFAWASYHFTPTWCQAKEDKAHWTVRFEEYLFTTCPCCLLFRGIACGLCLSAVPWLIVLWLVAEFK
jgi:hypothetical protein